MKRLDSLQINCNEVNKPFIRSLLEQNGYHVKPDETTYCLYLRGNQQEVHNLIVNKLGLRGEDFYVKKRNL